MGNLFLLPMAECCPLGMCRSWHSLGAKLQHCRVKIWRRRQDTYGQLRTMTGLWGYSHRGQIINMQVLELGVAGSEGNAPRRQD